MSLIDGLIADLERLRPKDTQPQQKKELFVTPVTPAVTQGVTRQAPCLLAVTHVTPVTQKKQGYGNSAPQSGFIDVGGKRIAIMTEAELEQMDSRQMQYQQLGLAEDEATAIAEHLFHRDRDGDDRKACIECAGCTSGWRCTRARQAGLRSRYGVAYLGRGEMLVLQRCPGFVQREGDGEG